MKIPGHPDYYRLAGLPTPPRPVLALALLVLLTSLPCFTLSISAAPTPSPPSHPTPPPGTLRVSGLGLLHNRAARLAVQQLWPEKKLPPVLPVGFLEDATHLLRTMQVEEGFLQASIEVRLTRPDGLSTNFLCGPELEFLWPTDWTATRVQFHAHRGRRYYFHQLDFESLDPLPASQARALFYPTDSLLSLPSDRPFNPAQFDRSLRNLRLELHNHGYRHAQVQVTRLHLDHPTGRVSASIQAIPGPLLRVRTLIIETRTAPDEPILDHQSRDLDQPYTLLWEQDLHDELTRAQFAQGYPDATVRLRELPHPNRENTSDITLVAEVNRGPRIRLGQLEFQGHRHTRESFLRQKASLTGPYLNRLEADRARHRLARLGIFDTVYVDYPEATNDLRHVRYTLVEGRTIDVRVPFGFGSYDLLFAGLELDQYNLFGLGHHTRLFGLQSFKSTLGRYTYTIPEFLGPELTAFADADALYRQELSFDRRELKLGAGLRQAFPATSQQLGARYSYEFLNADNRGGQLAEEETQVAAFILDWSLERRNNPLLPRRGYRASLALEWADPILGGEARYQRLEASLSYHHPLARATFLHLGLWHGVAADLSAHDASLPFNKRFFPGGERSLRGYQRGEASPVDAYGNQLGAESAVVANLELEQAITRNWSLVGFLDAGGVTPSIDHYPFDETLLCLGGGLRWNTPVGPLRLEYGHNLNPRATDPAGTLHFSIGFPF